jgi:hypothetical protein
MFGVHAERGVETVRDIAMYFAGHDINHFKQIETIRCSTIDVGVKRHLTWR